MLDIVADLYEYPDEPYKSKLEIFLSEIKKSYPEFEDRFLKFYSSIINLPIEKIQELFIKTFELNPECTPYVGIHIFGEDEYKRSTFMSRLKQAYEENGISPKKEIFDHITLVLKLSSRLTDKNKKNDLLSECIIPPLNSMQEELKDKLNPYNNLLLLTKELAEFNLTRELNHA